MPFSPNQERLGSLFAESVNLAIEQGVTRTSGNAGVVTMNNSIASVVKQATVDANAIILQATISWDLVAKARQPNSAQSFENAMTQVVDNTLLSHRRHQVSDMLYGGTNIGVVLTGASGTTITLDPKSTAPGVWYGSNNMLIDVVDPTLATKRNANPLSLVSYVVDPTSASRTLTVDQSVTTTAGDYIVFSGSVDTTNNVFLTPPGLEVISSMQGGTLFGLSQQTYNVFQGSVYDAGNTSLTLDAIDQATTLPLIRGYTGKIKLFVHPKTFSNIVHEEVSRIFLSGSQVKGTAEVGYDTVRFVTSAGARVECEGSPWIKEGIAFLVPMDGTLRRIGAVDIQLGGPADPQPTWRRIESQTGYSLPTYSLQAPFTAEPWKLCVIHNIVNA